MDMFEYAYASRKGILKKGGLITCLKKRRNIEKGKDPRILSSRLFVSKRGVDDGN